MLKIETIKIRSIRLLSDDGDGNKNLLSELDRDSMKVKSLKSLCIKIYKTLNDLNPSYMKKVFPIKLQNKTVRTFHEKNLINNPDLLQTCSHFKRYISNDIKSS